MLRRAMMANAAVPGAWALATQWTPDGNSIGWGGTTLRQVIPASALLSGSKLRLTLRAATSENCDIVAIYVQHAAASGDAYDFATTPVQIRRSGAGSFRVNANTESVMDALDFAVDASRNLVVSAYFLGGSDTARISSHAGWASYYKSGDDTTTVNASGYSASAFAANLVRKVEVYQP